MTPATKLAKKKKIYHIVHEYTHNPSAPSYGLEAADALGLPPDQVFKTLMVSLAGASPDLAVAIVPVAFQLDLKAVAKAFGAKKAQMADPQKAQRVTGYVLGGISPIGQKKQLPTAMDESCFSFNTIFVSAGRRGLEIELSPADLKDLTGAVSADIKKP